MTLQRNDFDAQVGQRDRDGISSLLFSFGTLGVQNATLMARLKQGKRGQKG